MVIERLLKFRIIWIASSQLFGLASFTIVAKFLLDTSDMPVLASYQGTQALTAFLMMSIQFSNSRSQVFGFKFALFFISIYFISIFAFSSNGKSMLWNVCLAMTFAAACYSNLLLTALEKFNILIFLQVACSILFPFAIIKPVLTAGIFLIILFVLFSKFRDAIFNLPDMRFFQDGRNWASSLSMQAPLVLLPVFDQALIHLIGGEAYRNYAIYTKYCTGPINLLFSTAQFRILEKKVFDFRRLYAFCFVLFLIASVLVIFKSELIFQIILFIIFTNCVSLLVRTNNLLQVSVWSFAAGPVALFGYFIFLKYSKNIYFQITDYFMIAPIMCVASAVIFSNFTLVKKRQCSKTSL